MSVVTLVSTVGSKKAPPALRLPSTATLAPIFTASAMCASNFSTTFICLPRSYLTRIPRMTREF